MLIEPAVSLRIAPRQMGLLTTLLGQGVRLRIATGRSLRNVLVEQIGMNTDYLEKRVQTVFVNGRPVDDFDQVAVEREAVIALSAAMPGLAGATLRRGGHLAAMRRQISQAPDRIRTQPPAGAGLITLKLFNVVAREVGPQVLAKGILLTCRELDSLLELLAADSAQPPSGWLELEGVPVDRGDLNTAAGKAEYACLKIRLHEA